MLKLKYFQLKYSVYTKIARKTGISLSLLRNLENSMIRTVIRFMDINYLPKCEELGIIPEFLKFKPQKLQVYDNVDRFYKKRSVSVIKNCKNLV